MSEPVTTVLREIHRRRRHLRDLQEEIDPWTQGHENSGNPTGRATPNT